MKRLMLVAVLTIGLAACDNAAEESDEVPAAEATPATEATAADAGAETSMAGTYEFELDGKPTTSVMMADGTYTDSQDGQVTEKGLWSEHDGKTCFDPEGDDTPGICFTTTEPNAEGVFTATGDDGTVLTIKKTA